MLLTRGAQDSPPTSTVQPFANGSSARPRRPGDGPAAPLWSVAFSLDLGRFPLRNPTMAKALGQRGWDQACTVSLFSGLPNCFQPSISVHEASSTEHLWVKLPAICLSGGQVEGPACSGLRQGPWVRGGR